MKKNIKHNDITELIVSSVTGNISANDKAYLDNWINQNEANKNIYQEYLKTWKAFENESLPEIDIDKEWKIFRKNSEIKNKSIYITAFKYAATVLIISAISIFIYYYLNQNNQIKLTSFNQTTLKTLPDGTSINLNNNTTISYPYKFDKNIRLVKLKGEAFFNVTHNTNQPFIVDAGNVFVKVVGTSFFVSNKSDSITEVIVKTGKVSVFDKNNVQTNTFLTPGEHLKVNKNNVFTKTIETNENYIAWKTHLFDFENQNIKDVTNLLEKTFNTKIIVDKKLTNCTITATFKNQNLMEILNVIKATLNLKITTNNNTIELSGEGC